MADDMLSIVATMLDALTGQTHVYRKSYSPETDREFADVLDSTNYYWTEGNFSCDGNRMTVAGVAFDDANHCCRHGPRGTRRMRLLSLTVDGVECLSQQELADEAHGVPGWMRASGNDLHY